MARRDLTNDIRVIGLAVVVAALFGLVHDLIDVQISPGFYRVVKGVPGWIPVWLGAAGIGLTSGAVLGLVAGVAFCIAADAGQETPLPLAAVRSYIYFPAVAAAGGSALGGIGGGLAAPWLERWLGLTGLRATELWIVAGMHNGVYAGAFVGILAAATAIYRSRQRAICT